MCAPVVVQDKDLSDEQRKILSICERTFKCYIIEDPAAMVRLGGEGGLGFWDWKGQGWTGRKGVGTGGIVGEESDWAAKGDGWDGRVRGAGAGKGMSRGGGLEGRRCVHR